MIVPPILLEGDAEPAPVISGRGERFALPPQSVPSASSLPEAAPTLSGELPEAYGTGEMFLTARDPHWLYVAWDLTNEQRNSYNERAQAGHLAVRTFVDAVAGTPVVETDVYPDSKSWFIPVPHAGTRYVAELGYYRTGHQWQAVAISRPTMTPPENLSGEETIEFATIPPQVTLKEVFEAVQEVVKENASLALVVERAAQELSPPRSLPPATEPEKPSPIEPAPTTADAMPPQNGTYAKTNEDHPIRSEEVSVSSSAPAAALSSAPPVSHLEGHPAPARRIESPRPSAPSRSAPPIQAPWTPAQARALAKVVWLDEARRVWMGSLEITELIRRHLRLEITSPAERGQEQLGPEFELQIMPAAPTAGVSSLSITEEIAPPGQKSFWMNINAELVLYGATEPTARVKIGGRQIRLRADGTFSYRFALPDGQYPLAIAAEAADSDESRSVALQFSRRTQVQGDVKSHPQDPQLQPPLEKNVH